MKKPDVPVRSLSPSPSPASGRGEENKFILPLASSVLKDDVKFGRVTWMGYGLLAQPALANDWLKPEEEAA